jgi:hypothetical protein
LPSPERLSSSAKATFIPGGRHGMSYACLQQRRTEFAAPAQPESGSPRAEIPEIPANALLAQLVEHFHGKEGVVGSSPTEGFR